MAMIASLLKQYPAISIELASHTDSRGTDAYNQDLSQRRANGVVEYLVAKGVDSNRLTPKGYGESQPRNQCADGVACPEREHARNRRTEIRILSGAQGASLVYMDGKPTGAQVISLGDLPVQNPAEPTAEPNTEPISKTADKPAEDQSEAPKVNVSPDAAAETTVAAPSGAGFYVVSGSFTKEARAQAHAGTIKNAGFPDAEIMQFPNSPYFSVVVGKFENRTEADALKQKLADSNLQAFIRIVSAN
jgi:cell division septation protein DedD